MTAAAYLYMSPERALQLARELTAMAHRVAHVQIDQKNPSAHAYFQLGTDVNKGTKIKIRIGEDVK